MWLKKFHSNSQMWLKVGRSLKCWWNGWFYIKKNNLYNVFKFISYLFKEDKNSINVINLLSLRKEFTVQESKKSEAQGKTS